MRRRRQEAEALALPILGWRKAGHGKAPSDNPVKAFLLAAGNGTRLRPLTENTPKCLLPFNGVPLLSRDWVAREKFFWILYADVLTNMDLRALLDFHKACQTAATLAVYRVPDPSRCGIVTLGKNGVVQEFVEKPAIPCSNLAFSGVLIGTEQLLQAIPNRLPADIGFDVLPRLVNQMSAYETSDYLLDIGTIQNYKQAQVTWPGLGNGEC